MSEEEFSNAIEQINETLAKVTRPFPLCLRIPSIMVRSSKIPTLRIGYAPCLPCTAVTLILICLMFLPESDTVTLIALGFFAVWLLLTFITIIGTDSTSDPVSLSSHLPVGVQLLSSSSFFKRNITR